MSEATNLIITAVVVVIIVGLIIWLDQRSKPKKPVQEPAFEPDEGHPAFRRFLRLLTILVLGIAAIIGTFYGALWVRQNPTAGLPILIILIILSVLAKPLHLIHLALEVIKWDQEQIKKQKQKG